MKNGARFFYAIAGTLGAITACSMSANDADSLARGKDDDPTLGTGGTTSLGPGTQEIGRASERERR